MTEEEMTCPSYSRVEMQVNSPFAVSHKSLCCFLFVSAFGKNTSLLPPAFSCFQFSILFSSIFSTFTLELLQLNAFKLQGLLCASLYRVVRQCMHRGLVCTEIAKKQNKKTEQTKCLYCFRNLILKHDFEEIMASATLYSTCTQTLMQTGEACTQAHA